jgi:hypothetical protein
MDSLLEEGICWECRSTDFGSFVGPLCRTSPTLPGHHEWTRLYTVLWKNIRRDCALCSELKSLFPLPSTVTNDSSSHQLGPFHLECFSKRLDEDATIPKHIELRLWNGLDMFHAVHLLPDLIAQKLDAEIRDLTMVKRWIDHCQGKHYDACRRNHCPTNLPLRVIDCISHQVVCIKPGIPYVCLSYVWGMSVAGKELLDFSQVLPKTIEDSIWVAIQLGIPYLWVDRYCIDQTNDAEKHHLIQNMDTIYRNAALTIVAASGNDPHAGLPGINGTYRPQQRIFTGGPSDLTFIALHNPTTEIWNSTWNKRAWTFQERCLSRRLLVFTDSQIYFQCEGMHCIEGLSTWTKLGTSPSETITCVSEGVRRGLKAIHDSKSGDDISYLYSKLQEYYRRKISFIEDIIKAVLGILNAPEPRNGTNCVVATQIYGLPVCSHRQDTRIISPSAVFTRCLAWTIYGQDESWDLPASRSTLYPSWSWASIKADRHPASAGKLEFSFNYDRFEYEEDIRIWVTQCNGNHVDMDYYVNHTKNRNNEDLNACILIESWTVKCYLSVEDLPEKWYTPASRKHHLSGFLDGVVHLDFPKQQPSGELIAIYIGTTTLFCDEIVFLIVQRNSSSTYQRVGVYLAIDDPVVKEEGIEARLNAVRPGGGWEMLRLSLV